jgi:hypothetical protein
MAGFEGIAWDERDGAMTGSVNGVELFTLTPQAALPPREGMDWSMSSHLPNLEEGVLGWYPPGELLQAQEDAETMLAEFLAQIGAEFK